MTQSQGYSFSPNISTREQRKIQRRWPLRRIAVDIVYLGNKLFVGQNKRESFDNIKQKVTSRLEGWKAKLVFARGRATIIRSVANSIPIYNNMSTLKIPSCVCREMDAALGFRRFELRYIIIELYLLSWGGGG
ncbi:hypothetical protein PanWU01x14_056320 [Parasponia andersonii]|uniref:Uncharacterized protein n=1 Tax=Parasponia andersonii TaxID=3476 RepID=A0A2P5DKB7_PARAD|nr:hypothetical protein PanWU01x14_056320 [Parasponia andersonii]